MMPNPTPRQLLSSLLQGTRPPRPLLLPIVFSLGAKIENLPLRDFLSNPTKISNSLRQIRSYLPSDGVSCYFDPSLELESLGASLSWSNDTAPPTIHWPHPVGKGSLPPALRSPEDAARAPRVKIAAEVITRLKSSFRDEPILMAGVSGPFTLAARLLQLDAADSPRAEDFPEAALEISASTIAAVSSAFVEAGANLIIICEEILPSLSLETCQAWQFLLSPALNIIRFHEAFPVLHFSNFFTTNASFILAQPWDCVLCPPLDAVAHLTPEQASAASAALFGLSLPPELFQPDTTYKEDVTQLVSRAGAGLNPVLLTTTSDVPHSTDLKRLIKVMEESSRSL